MNQDSSVELTIDNNIAQITFSHPKGNSLPGTLLGELAEQFNQLATNQDARVVVLRSAGERAFCAGASFDELQAISDQTSGKKFFMGFANLIVAMKSCPKFVLTRVQGKAVGGGVGVCAASDYVFAHNSSAIKLSELALGIGPFVVGPCVERKIGNGPFSAMSIDADWRDAKWALQHGLFTHLFDSHEAQDEALMQLATKLSQSSPAAMAQLKKAIWAGTEDWDVLLEKRAQISGELVLSDFTRDAIAGFKGK